MGGVGGEKGEMGKEGDIEGEEKGGRENKNKKGTKGGIEERNIPFFGLVYYFQNHDHDCVGVALHTYYKRGEEEEEEEEREEGEKEEEEEEGEEREEKATKSIKVFTPRVQTKTFLQRRGLWKGRRKGGGEKGMR